MPFITSFCCTSSHESPPSHIYFIPHRSPSLRPSPSSFNFLPFLAVFSVLFSSLFSFSLLLSVLFVLSLYLYKFELKITQFCAPFNSHCTHFVLLCLLLPLNSLQPLLVLNSKTWDRYLLTHSHTHTHTHTLTNTHSHKQTHIHTYIYTHTRTHVEVVTYEAGSLFVFVL